MRPIIGIRVKLPRSNPRIGPLVHTQVVCWHLAVGSPFRFRQILTLSHNGIILLLWQIHTA